MEIIISNADDRPIYEQIYKQIKKYIMSGKLCEGDALPSIRSLAKDLRISVITTKRAYDELEKDGYINTVASKGCYVAAKNKSIIREQYLTQIETHLREAAELAQMIGLSEDEVIKIFKTLKEEEYI
ncbi:MAG: GntR family transcriptional regulator [Oscillospiraceae bacterium]|nr:GntR family transcriptional regulator [Oscillospiraceae bacterium]